MDEINNMEALDDTNVQELPGGEQNADEQAEDASQANAGQEAGGSSENQQDAENKAFLPIRYNHEDVTLTRDEAVKFAQLGKLYSDSGLDIGTVKPIYSKLDYVAALKGTTPEALVDNMIAEDERMFRQGLVEKFGEDSEELEILVQAHRDTQKQKYDEILKTRTETAENAAKEQQESLNSRLANEFLELQAEFPEIADFESVPKEVKEMAVKGNKDLLSAYLIHKNREDKKIATAKASDEAAKKSTTGSGASSEKLDDGVISALLSGIWN